MIRTESSERCMVLRAGAGVNPALLIAPEGGSVWRKTKAMFHSKMRVHVSAGLLTAAVKFLPNGQEHRPARRLMCSSDPPSTVYRDPRTMKIGPSPDLVKNNGQRPGLPAYPRWIQCMTPNAPLANGPLTTKNGWGTSSIRGSEKSPEDDVPTTAPAKG